MNSRPVVKVWLLVIFAAFTVCAAAQAQEHVRLMPQLGSGPITSVALSPNGHFVLTGSEDNTARLWDATTGSQIRSFVGHTNAVTSVAFSPDGRFVFTGSLDHTVRSWNMTTGQQIHSYSEPSEEYLPEDLGIWSLAVSPDGHSLLTGSDDYSARLWDVTTGEQIEVLHGHTKRVTSVAFSHDGQYVLTGSSDKTARLWSAATGKQIRTFTGHLGAIESVAISRDGHYVLTGSDDRSARLWNAATGEQIRSFDGQNGWVLSVAFSIDGRSVLTGGTDAIARLWNTETGQEIGRLISHSSSVTSVVFSKDGGSFLTGSYDKTARLWSTATRQQIHLFTGHTNPVISVLFSPDSRYLLNGNDDNTARLWDTATGQQTRLFKAKVGSIESVALSPDDRSILIATDAAVQLWDTTTGQELRTFEEKNRIVHTAAGIRVNLSSVAFSPDGRLALLGVDIGLWDTSDWHLMHVFGNFFSSDVAMWAGFSPDGRSIVTVDVSGKARIRDVSTGREIAAFRDHFIYSDCVVFSPDGHSLLTAGDRSARLWDASTARLLRSFQGHIDTITSVAFSPDGRSVVTGSRDNSVRVWDEATGQQIRTFDAHLGPVESVAFSRDGRFILTGGDDTTTRLWDAATGKELAVLLSFDNGGWAVTDSDGRYDASDPENTPGLVWVTDKLHSIELRDLKDAYYTPNLLARILKGERLPEVTGLDQVPAPPDVAILKPFDPQTAKLSLRLINAGGGVGRLVVNVNDRLAKMVEHPIERKVGNQLELSVDLSRATVQPGENTVKAYAFDVGNHIRSHVATASFQFSPQTKGLTPEANVVRGGDAPQFYGIVVGTARFGNPAMNLQYPERDAQSLMTALKVGSSHLFGEDHVHLRILSTSAEKDADRPTKKNIVEAFEDVRRKAKPTDVLLVYFSGHGVSLRGERDSYYYLTEDARSLELETDSELKNLSTVSSGELTHWLGGKNMPLKEVLILDTCAAGAASAELAKLIEKRDVPPDQRRAVEFLKDATGTVILMGSAADKSSYEASKYGEGLLTYALLDGMRGRSIGDGWQLNVSRWFQNASEEVPLLAQSIGGIQKPQIAAPVGTGFPVALLDPTDQAKIPLAVIKPELLHLTCHDENDEDPLGLAMAVRERMREISHPSARGAEAEPPIVYLDDVTDGPDGTLTPKIVYSVTATKVSLRLRIDSNGQTIGEMRINVDGNDKNVLVDEVATKLVEMAEKVPLNIVRQ